MNVVIRSLSRSYGRVQALTNINLTIETGMFGLLGPNGAGKSTLMRILSTLLPPSEGTARIGTLDIRKDQHQVRELLGYLPQDFGLYKKLTAQEFLDLVGCLKGCRDRKARTEQVEQVLHQVNLWDKRHSKMGTFSGGMKRRAGIAQALMGNPKLLIVDEPTAGLDPEERVRFRNLLTELSGQLVVILSTHIVSDIESSCNQLAVLQKGRLLFTGNQQGLISQAQGAVWQVETSEQEMNHLKKMSTIVSTRRTPEGLSLRLLSTEKPIADAVSLEPTLEDGYMAMITVQRGEESHAKS